MEAVDALDHMAHEKGCTLGHARCLSKPGITSAILGARTLAHLIDQLGALNIILTEEDHQRIDHICATGKTLVSYYYEDSSADLRPAQYRH